MAASTSSKKFVISIAIVIIALAFLLFAFSATGMLTLYTHSKQEVINKIKNIFELSNPGTTIEILSINEESGLYKFILKARSINGVNYMEVYATKDGKLLIENVVPIESSLERMKKLNSLADCLYEKGVRIYGLSNDTGTLLQLNVLGRNSAKLFVLCDGDMLQQCMSIGIKEVPSVVINETIYTGAKAPEWLAQQAGCKI
ncbi:MAG: hypothetical protein QXQ40_02320 [Candidatus Aenigmatarchaeota archaeon]